MRSLPSLLLACLAQIILALFGCSQDSPDCPDGVEGRCGLLGVCVDCITDHDCDQTMVCLSDGNCAFVTPCSDNDECPLGLQCFAAICAMPCEDHSDCQPGERCNGQYCFKERCTSEGVCPDGWEPVDDTLVCHYSGD